MSRTMSNSRLTLRRPQRSASKKSGIEFERIMVQITFAFVIILGYLLSVGIDAKQELADEVETLKGENLELADDRTRLEGEKQELAAEVEILEGENLELADEKARLEGETQELAAEVEEHKALNTLLEEIVTDLKETDIGQEREARIAAQKDVQLLKLFHLWEQQRKELPLVILLGQFVNPDLISLSDDMDCLPATPGFPELGKEAAKIFPVEGQKVSASEVARLTTVVLKRAGLNPAISEQEPLSPDIDALHFDRKSVTQANRRTLELKIFADLEDERKKLVNIQYALVGKIASARQDKLADLPLTDEAGTETEEVDLGIAMLEDVLAGLKKRMQLLPEVLDRIRGELADLEAVESPQ